MRLTYGSVGSDDGPIAIELVVVWRLECLSKIRNNVSLSPGQNGEFSSVTCLRKCVRCTDTSSPLRNLDGLGRKGGLRWRENLGNPVLNFLRTRSRALCSN